MRELISNYIKLKRPFAAESSIRPGYYLPIEFIELKRTDTNWIIKALAFWSDEPTFEKYIYVEVVLSPLFNRRSYGPVYIHPSSLLESIVQICEFNLISDIHDDVEYSPYQVKWNADMPKAESASIPPTPPKVLSIPELLELLDYAEFKYFENETILNTYEPHGYFDEQQQLLLDEDDSLHCVTAISEQLLDPSNDLEEVQIIIDDLTQEEQSNGQNHE